LDDRTHWFSIYCPGKTLYNTFGLGGDACYGLWLLLVLRLLMPVSPPSALSIFKLAKLSPKQAEALRSSHLLRAAVGSRPAADNSRNIPLVSESPGAPLRIQKPVVGRPAVKLDWFAVAFCGYLAGVCFFAARLAGLLSPQLSPHVAKGFRIILNLDLAGRDVKLGAQ
jgi:hypothetical protein